MVKNLANALYRDQVRDAARLAANIGTKAAAVRFGVDEEAVRKMIYRERRRHAARQNAAS